jgi:hypothetical protein
MPAVEHQGGLNAHGQMIALIRECHLRGALVVMDDGQLQPSATTRLRICSASIGLAAHHRARKGGDQ